MDPKTPLITPGLDETLAASDAPGDQPPARVVAGRYRMEALLGRGGSGHVFRALDLITGGPVALKLLDPLDDAERARVAREAAALRLLRLPGVAALLDEGVDGPDTFLVMELVEGAPFPGRRPPVSWESLSAPTRGLLGTVHRIHAAGIVHRDLKPGNVLVGADGRARVLDFGLARGAPLGSTVTRAGSVVGTPRYLAPEQARGLPADPRTDLYALGVMLFEALAGYPPHLAEDVPSLLHLKVHEPAPALRDRVPAAPGHVAALVDRLLARDPDDRPGSAAEALAMLGGSAPTGRHLLPRLGGDGPVDAVVAALAAGRAVDVVGPRGSGRTRALEEAAARLGAAGREIAWLPPGERPFESLRAVLHPGDLDRLASDDVVGGVAALLAARLAAGLVVVADDAARLDRWSAGALRRARGEGAVARALEAEEDPAGTVSLAPLPEEALRALFKGPDRLLHRREDAARSLVERTAGLPARVVAEVSAWVGEGAATWDDGLLAVSGVALRPDRPPGGARVDLEATAGLTAPQHDLLAWVALAAPHATRARLAEVTGRPGWELAVELEELAARGAVEADAAGRLRARVPAPALARWERARRLDAHRALAARLAPGTEGRLRHLLAAGEAEEVAEEAARRVAGLVRGGRLADAMAEAEAALAAVRARGDGAHEEALLHALARAALAQQAREPLERARYEVRRAREPTDALARLGALLEATLDAQGGEAARGAAAAAALGPFADEELEIWRHAARLNDAFQRGNDATEALLEDVGAWAAGASARARARHAGWLGKLRYKESRFDEAAALQARAAALADDVPTRLSALVNAGLALLDAFRPAEARARAEEALDLARAHRLPHYEMHAEWILRAARYRAAEPLEPDLELVEAVRALGDRGQGAMVAFGEAAIAWRAGRADVAARLAGEARDAWRQAGWATQATVAEALRLAIAGEAPPEEAVAVEEAARACPWPRVALQALGLLRIAGWEPADGWKARAEALASDIAPQHRAVRLEVLSAAEALDGLGVP